MVILSYILIFLKNAIYGMTVFFTGSLTKSTDVLDILALRFLLSFVVFEILKRTKILKINIGFKDYCGKTERSQYFKSLFFCALFEPVLYMLFETLGISMLSGIMTGVLLSLAPIFSISFASIFLHEKTSVLEKLLIFIGIIGVGYVAICSGNTEGENSILGMFFIILALVSSSFYIVFSRKSSKQFTSMEITYFASFLGMMVFNTVNIIRHLICGDILKYFEPYFDFENMIGFLFLSVVATIIAVEISNFTVSRVKIATVAAFGGVSTFVTIAAGVFLGGEKLQTFHIIGITLMTIRMIGVCYLTYEKNKLENLNK